MECCSYRNPMVALRLQFRFSTSILKRTPKQICSDSLFEHFYVMEGKVFLVRFITYVLGEPEYYFVHADPDF